MKPDPSLWLKHTVGGTEFDLLNLDPPDVETRVMAEMAAGVAVLGYDTGGVIEQVDPGVTGLLVPTGDRAALMQLFATLPSRADLGRLGAAGRARFLAEFTLERMLDRTLAHFETQMLDRAA